jgi:hypothetical protein
MAGKTASVDESMAKQKAESPNEYVVLKGAQHFAIRRITEADWQRVGVESGRQVEWSKDNGFRVPKSDLDFLTPEQFDRYINADSSFTLVRE